MAALLRELHRKNPDALFEALYSLYEHCEELPINRLSLVAEALTLWPDCDSRFVFPIADGYSLADLGSAAQWAAKYLTTTGRSDLNVTSILGRYAEVSGEKALRAISALPPASQSSALQAAAYHLPITDFQCLHGLCEQLDSDGSHGFTKLLFQRLSMEHLDEVAAWIAKDKSAASIPGAVVAVADALVIEKGGAVAVEWADKLPQGSAARAEAIAKVYQRWSQINPGDAVDDILAAYPDALHLVREVYAGAADHVGSGALGHWDEAAALENPTARTYALVALVEPLLLRSGKTEVSRRIGELPANSNERIAAELAYKAALEKPDVVLQLDRPE